MSAKLNYELAQIIRARFAAGELGKVLAYEYGVTKTTISMIVTGRIWQCRDSGLAGSQSSNELNRRERIHASTL